MIPGINARQMEQAMKKLGVKQTEIPAQQVIIKLEDMDLIINNPSVSIVNMMGQESFQITGDIEEREKDSSPDIKKEDIETVMQSTGCSEKNAIEAIKNNSGDLAAAIMEINEE